MIKSPTQATAIVQFLKNLKADFAVPKGVEIMNPFADNNAFELVKKFYLKFYDDHEPRSMIFGINPGRFGGGVTGIPFTDPVKLVEFCGIANDYKKQKELSADFVYAFINAYGGPEIFYKRFFITAISPLGFTLNGKNMNYYDDKELTKAAENFIVECTNTQIAKIKTSDTCFCLGEGQNFQYFSKLNATHGFFKQIIPLPHPRWIMQYRRKKMEEYVELYITAFRNDR